MKNVMKFNLDGKPNIYWVVDRVRKWWGKCATWESVLDEDHYLKTKEFRYLYFKVGYQVGKLAGEFRFYPGFSDFRMFRHDQVMWYGDPINLKDAVDKAEEANHLEHYRFDNPMWWFRYRDHVGD